ncbi:hypothetical protein BJA5080_04666 [Bradyrhizobium diazoefficiens SEMIA 5080]|uniref:Uncharacterized protein n=1 Tax=Bradyrhizobium diazoefficiens SEMIA 5080 TaxID=754504 RepID=A0A837CKZ5_9BRAD|nr:hypothetical protein BJA5080_04666 [Bradyrhizobium diazoefficiens SEMIA 5080]
MGKAISGTAARTDPGYRFAHPGYKSLRCPTGKTPKLRVNPLKRKYSTLPKFGFGVFVRHLIPVRGRIAIVTTCGVSCGGR